MTELKKCIANVSILNIIVSKFCYKKKLYPIILLKVYKNLEVGFYYTILPLNLPVYLQIKSDRESLLDAEEIIYQ